MLSSWKWLLIVVALVAAIAFGACGDGGGDGGDDGEEPAATKATEGGENGGEDEGAGEDVSAEIRELASEWANREATITYEFSGAGVQEGTFTLYWSPPDFSRFDMTMQGVESAFIVKGDTSYICSSTDGGGQCLEYPAEQGANQLPLSFLGSFTDPGLLETTVAEAFTGIDVDRSEREIAGQSARCYAASGGGGDVEWCFSDDGLLLFASSGAGAARYTMEATSVEGSVAAADKEPPYPVQQIPGP